MDDARRKVLYNACRPEESLKPEDGRNYDLDTAGPGNRSVRGKNWVRTLSGGIRDADVSQCYFFTGLSGSGKTTEFLRLKKRLEELDFLPVYINSEDLLDLATPIDLPDILLTILYKADQAVLEFKGLPPERAAAESGFERFWHWMTSTEVSLTKVEAGMAGSKAVLELRDRPSLRQQIRDCVKNKVSEFARECQIFLQKLDETVRDAGKNGLVIIYDSLEKLQGLVSNYEAVLDSAEKVFCQMGHHLALPVHAIYTVPSALLKRTSMPVEFFPMIKVKTRDGSPDDPGMNAARELVRRRVPDEDLRELLGPGCEERIRTVILRSGGYPRDIVRMLRQIVRQEEQPVPDFEFERILNESAERYRRQVTIDAYPLLARVAMTKEFNLSSEEHRLASHMLTNNVIMRYLNAAEWYDLHPAVAEMPGVVKAVRKLEAEEAAG